MSEEQVLFKGSSSPVIKFASFFWGTLVLIGSIALSFFFMIWFLIPGVVALIFMAIQWLLIKCRTYEITTERVRITTGIFSKRTEELELYRVQDMALIEPFLERMLGLGNIHLATNDVSAPVLEIEAIRGARQLREDLRKSVEACREKKRVRITEFE